MDRWQKYLEAKCDQLASFFHERLNSATLKDADGKIFQNLRTIFNLKIISVSCQHNNFTKLSIFS